MDLLTNKVQDVVIITAPIEDDCPYGVNGNHVWMDGECSLCGKKQ